jgi:fido (protein-threonine AMPylation protein)
VFDPFKDYEQVGYLRNRYGEKEPSKVMGLFAYGHPFLDGNGRTMLIIHSELCRRYLLLNGQIRQKRLHLNHSHFGRMKTPFFQLVTPQMQSS